MELFKLFGRIAIDNNEANEALDDTSEKGEKAESRLSSSFKKIGGAVATYFAVDKIINFGKEVVNMAASVSAETSAFEQIMGDYSSAASEKVDKIADATGMVSTRLTPYMTSMTAKFKGLGYDIDDATDLASEGLNLAADAAAFWDKSLDDSMSHLNSFINGSYEGGEAIGLFANDTQMASYAVSKGLVSQTKDWATLNEATKQATRLEYAKMMYEQSGATGQAAKEADQYANVQANLTEKWRQFKAQIGEPLLQRVVLPAMKKLSEFVDKASKKFKDLQKWVSKNKLWLGILAATIGVVTLALTIQAGVQAVKSAMNAAEATTLGGLIAAKLADAAATMAALAPYLLIAAAIAAVIAVIVLLVKNWDKVKEAASNAWEKIKEVWENVSTWFNENIIEPIKEFFSGMWEAITGFFSGAWEAIKEVWNTVATWFSENVIEPVKTFFSPLFEWFSKLFKSIWDYIASAFKVIGQLASGCVEIIKAVWGIVSGWFNEKVVTPVRNFFTKLWEGIKNAASKAWNGIKNIWNVVSGWFNEKIITPVNKFFSGMWEKLKNGAKNAWEGIKSVFSKVSDWFKNTFSKAWQKVKDVFSTGGKIFDGIKEGIADAFKTVVNGIIRGINKVVSVPFNAINTVLDKIRNASIAGIKPFSGLSTISVPQIPELAKGGILKKGQIGLLEGDGAEAVVPLEKNKEWISRISNELNKSNDNKILTDKIDTLISMMAEFMPEIIKNSKKQIVLDNGVLVGELASGMDSRLGEINRLRERGR